MAAEIDLAPTALTFEIQAPGAVIPCRSWGNPANAFAIVIAVHGLGSHGGWFEALGRRMGTTGVYLVSYDQAGFGARSRQPLKSYRQWITDLRSVYSHFHNLHAEAPLFLLGNSMGASVCMAGTADLCPAGLILCSPGFAGHPRAFNASYVLKALFSAVTAPRAAIREPYPIETISRSPAARDWMVHDCPGLVQAPGGGLHFTVIPAMLLELLRLNCALKGQMSHINSPVLMLTAGQEFIVDNRTNKSVFNRLKVPLKTYCDFPAAYHDLLLDPDIDEVTSQITAWMKKLVPHSV